MSVSALLSLSSHSTKCNGGVASSVTDFTGPLPPNHAEALLNQPEPGFPTFEDVCLHNYSNLRFVPSRSRPAFAQALSSALRCVILENTEEAFCWRLAGGRYGRHRDPAYQARFLGLPWGIQPVHGASCGTSTLRVQ